MTYFKVNSVYLTSSERFQQQTFGDERFIFIPTVSYSPCVCHLSTHYLHGWHRITFLKMRGSLKAPQKSQSEYREGAARRSTLSHCLTIYMRERQNASGALFTE